MFNTFSQAYSESELCLDLPADSSVTIIEAQKLFHLRVSRTRIWHTTSTSPKSCSAHEAGSRLRPPQACRHGASIPASDAIELGVAQVTQWFLAPKPDTVIGLNGRQSGEARRPGWRRYRVTVDAVE